MHAQGTLLMAMANGLPVVSTPYHFALELLQARTHAPLSKSSLHAIKSFLAAAAAAHAPLKN